jgi:hypothetical protein
MSKIDTGRYRFTPDKDTLEDVDLDKADVRIDGKRYTEADAERDAEATRTRGLSRGGVSLSKDGSHSPTVTVTLPREVRDLVKERAKAEGVSVSKWLRQLIEDQVRAA